MSNIQFRCAITRVAIIDPRITGGKIVQVGTVEEYVKEDAEIKVNIRLFDDLPAEMEETIQKNPACLRISEGLSLPQEVMIIPSRPKIIT